MTVFTHFNQREYVYRICITKNNTKVKLMN